MCESPNICGHYGVILHKNYIYIYIYKKKKKIIIQIFLIGFITNLRTLLFVCETILKGLDAFVTFSTIFNKGDNVCDFQFI